MTEKERINLNGIANSFLKASFKKKVVAGLLIIGVILALGWAARQGVDISLNLDLQARLDYLEVQQQLLNETLNIPINSTVSAMVKEANYIIAPHDSYYCLINGTDDRAGRLEYYSTNKTLVEQYALGNMTSGLLYMKDCTHNTSLTLTSTQMVQEGSAGFIRVYGSNGLIVAGWVNATSGSFTNLYLTNLYMTNGTTFGGATGPAGTTQGITASYVVFKNATATYMVNGVTSQIDYYNTASGTVINYALNNLTSGGRVFLRAATYTTSPTILLQYSNQELVGEGKASIIKLAAGANVDVVTISGSGVKDCRVADLMIDGTYASNSVGDGVHIDTAYVSWDACHILENLHIKNTAESGIYITGDTRVVYILNINVQYVGGRGMYLAGTDHYVFNCEVGFADRSGYYIKCTSTKFALMKAFACGQDNVAQDNAGFCLVGPDAACYCTFVDCTSEDGRYNGWLFYNSARDDVFSSCWARNNGRASANAWDGWNATTTCYRLEFASCWAYDSVTTQFNGWGFYGGCYQITLASCQGTGNGGSGVYMINTDYSTITGGTWNSNDAWGIQEGTGVDYVVVTSNVAMSNAVGGILTAGASSQCHLCYNSTTWVS